LGFLSNPAQAVQIDLSGGIGLSGTSATGTQFLTVASQPTGTGVIDSFLRIQANGVEQGFNTSNGTPLDTKAGNFTRDVTLSALPIVNRGGNNFYEILLDINESNGGNNEFLSLSKLRAFTRTGPLTSGQVTGVSNEAGALSLLSGGATSSFDLLGADTVKLNADLNSGSGSGDLLIFLPVNAINNSNPNANFYLYAEMGGGPQGQAFSAGAGFEEFAVRRATAVPDGGSTWMLLGTASSLFAVLRRARRS